MWYNSTKNTSKHCPDDLHGNLCCVSSCSILFEPQQILLTRIQLNALKCFQHDFVLLCVSSCTPLCILKEIRTKNSMRINWTPHCHFLQTEDIGEVHVGCLEPSSYNSVYSHNQTYGSEPCLTLVMCSLRWYCFSPSPRIHWKL